MGYSMKIKIPDKKTVFIKRTIALAVLFVWDCFAVGISILLALRISFPSGVPNAFGIHGLFDFLFYVPPPLMGLLGEYLTYCAIGFVVANIIFRCYSTSLRHYSFGDMLRSIASAALYCFSFIALHIAFPDYISMNIKPIVIHTAILLTLNQFGRMSIRMFYEMSARHSQYLLMLGGEKIKRTLIFGAGEAGIYLANKIRSNPYHTIKPVVFIDDNPSIKRRTLSGIKVYGGFDRIEEAIIKFNIDEVIVAIPTIDKSTLQRVVNICKDKQCKISRFGRFDDSDNLDALQVSQIKLEDLLRRDSVELNMDAVISFVKNKTVLVTGGAGSIGSEICRQVLSFGCEKLIIFDINENGLFDIENELLGKYDKSRIICLLGSIRDQKRLEELFIEHKPQIVFHAAAHKHVPMTEYSPKEAVKNNVFGTRNVASAAIIHNAEKFILISTDKAVNPANIMGATKRIAERSVQLLDTASAVTELCCVRFGNVLGSNGSVVPVFKRQIEAGGPVTVTHRDITRYFMTIPEAVQLVLEAGAMAKGGEIFCLNMGEPVKIYDMACDMIKLSGYEPEKDIKIEFIGLRPGEKMYEEISMESEDAVQTENEKIFIMKPTEFDTTDLSVTIKELEEALQDSGIDRIVDIMKVLVPTFKHNSSC